MTGPPYTEYNIVEIVPETKLRNLKYYPGKTKGHLKS